MNSEALNLPVAPNKAKLSIIFSFYNEEQNIPEAIRQLSSVLQGQIRDGHLGDYELMFVDDDSSDKSEELLVRAAREDKRIKVVRMARNFGHDVSSRGFCEPLDLSVRYFQRRGKGLRRAGGGPSLVAVT